jgi:GntP family gluconate:H+ symporter
MLNQILSLLVFFAGIVSVVIMTSKFKVLPFLALFTVAIVVGLVTGIPLADMSGVVIDGFSKSLGYTTIITVSAIIVGEIMKETGAIYVISRTILKAVGKENSSFAIGIAGYVVAFPVLCGDTAFILLSPLAKSLVASGAANPMNIILALAAGSFASYALLFPAAPLLPVTILGADIASSLILGLVASIPAVIIGLLIAPRLGNGQVSKLELTGTKSMDEQIAQYGKLPSVATVMMILMIPIVLIVGKSIITNILGANIPILDFLGDPVIALPLGVGLRLFLVKGKPMEEVNKWITKGVENSASVIMIVGAGSVLGTVLQLTGVGTFLGNIAMGFNLPALLVVFLIAAIMKTGQGGTTTTMITATSIILPLLSSMGLHPVMVAMTICAGAMIVVHVNDSFFWVVSGFSKMDVASGYKTISVLSAVMGITAFLVISLAGPTILGLA